MLAAGYAWHRGNQNRLAQFPHVVARVKEIRKHSKQIVDLRKIDRGPALDRTGAIAWRRVRELNQACSLKSSRCSPAWIFPNVNHFIFAVRYISTCPRGGKGDLAAVNFVSALVAVGALVAGAARVAAMVPAGEFVPVPAAAVLSPPMRASAS
jgi:hypothetical protein